MFDDPCVLLFTNVPDEVYNLFSFPIVFYAVLSLKCSGKQETQDLR